MRVPYIYVAAAVALSPLSAFAQTAPVAPEIVPPTAATSDAGAVSPLAVAAGIVAVVVVADIVSRGALSGPLLRAVGLQSQTPIAAVDAALPATVPTATVTAPAVPAVAPAVPVIQPWWRFW